MPVSKFGLWDLKGPDKLWQLIVLGSAEALGTGTVLFLGCSAALPFEGSEPSLLYVAFAFGFAISIAVMGVGHISGAHVNPAVSLTALVLGKLSPITFLIYVASQCFGAVIGMQSVLVAASGNISAEYCLNTLNSNISPLKGVFIESILTAILVLLVLSVWDPRNATKHDSAPVRFGIGVIALVIAGAKFTGCSMNPARSFAPTILSGHWENHWVYWVGPSIGGVLMGLYYKYLYLKDIDETTDTIKEDGVEDELLTKRDSITLKPVSKDDFVKTS